ncbi:hypothetical protein IFM89_031397 [Coptis chinensis]|uniref:Uncharacterized protein n=1 Tax=Coptis chinensis TaxID=261450 RepID=A0A835HI22_9MAGN|nr:hypothetical protein IFM89_031397 [Coptis chinensis]
MGNCLVLQDKFVKIMKTDGKILEYQTPLRVQQVLSEFSGHAISDSLPVQRHLCADTDMLSGRLYYLLPPPLPTKEANKSMITVSSTKEETKQGTGVVRIKIVITKQELKEMLAKGGIPSVDDMVSQLQKKTKDEVDCDRNCNGWKPVLQSIPE